MHSIIQRTLSNYQLKKKWIISSHKKILTSDHFDIYGLVMSFLDRLVENPITTYITGLIYLALFLKMDLDSCKLYKEQAYR
jgi:hypothetical protein